MKFKKRNGLYVPRHYMGCMGIEDTFPPNRSNVSAVRKGVMSPSGGGGTTGGSAGSAGTVCTLLDQCTGTDDNTGAETGKYYGQGLYYTASNATICQVDVNIQAVPIGGNMTVVIATMTGNNMDLPVLGTSASKAAASLSVGWNSFTFSPSISVTGGGGTKYAIAATCSLAGWTIYDSGTPTLDQGNFMLWLATGVNEATYAAYDPGLKIYTDV